MPSPDESHQQEDLESRVWNAIAAFEQIVETIPDDKVSLEALSHAYEQVGDLSRAREYLTRLVNVVLDAGDRDAAELLRERVARISDTDPIARVTLARIDSFLAAGTPPVKEFSITTEQHEAESRMVEESERRSSHVAAELSFAWTLFQAGELSQEEYALVAQDLSTISSNSALVTVSVLHTLHDRANRNLERVLAFTARDSGVPVIPLALFDVQEAVFSMIPREFMVRYGVMAFEMMGADVLVVLLNPYNKSLREKAESLTNRRCHYFMALPADFDAMIERLSRKEPTKAEGTPAAPTP